MSDQKFQPPSTRRELALITGASSGIGLEISRIMALEGFDLVLVARSTEKLSALARELSNKFGIKAHIISADLGAPKAAENLFAETEARGLTIDVLVNNAGYGSWGHFIDLDPQDSSGMLQLNILALTELTQLYAKSMAGRHYGRVLNVASTAAFQPGPLMAVYYATKAYVLSFSEAIANELKDSGVTVTCLCPGPTHSAFFDRAKVGESRMKSLVMARSEDVARLGYDAMMAGKSVAIAGTFNYLLANSVRLLPRSLATKISRFVADRP